MSRSLLALLLLPVIAVAAPPDFRQNNWGDSREQVLVVEGEPVRRSGEAWLWHLKIEGSEAIMTMRFVDNKLVHAAYSFVDFSKKDYDQVIEFFSLEETLVKKYGPPTTKKAAAPPTEETDPESMLEDLAKQIIANRAMWFSRWNTPSTTIIHAIRGENGAITHEVRYWSTAHDALLNRPPPGDL
jgi:hypothetical protein